MTELWQLWLMVGVMVGALLVIRVLRREFPRARMHWVLKKAERYRPSVPESTFVRVTGTVRVHERTVVAPLSGRECVAARSRFCLRQRYNNRVYESFTTAPFLVALDGGGDVLVEARYIRLALKPVELKKSDFERKQELLAEHRLNRGEAGRAWFEEVVVEPGVRVTVAGTLVLDPAGPDASERDFRTAPAATPRLTGTVKHPAVLGGPIDRQSADKG